MNWSLEPQGLKNGKSDGMRKGDTGMKDILVNLYAIDIPGERLRLDDGAKGGVGRLHDITKLLRDTIGMRKSLRESSKSLATPGTGRHQRRMISLARSSRLLTVPETARWLRSPVGFLQRARTTSPLVLASEAPAYQWRKRIGGIRVWGKRHSHPFGKSMSSRAMAAGLSTQIYGSSQSRRTWLAYQSRASRRRSRAPQTSPSCCTGGWNGAMANCRHPTGRTRRRERIARAKRRVKIPVAHRLKLLNIGFQDEA